MKQSKARQTPTEKIFDSRLPSADQPAYKAAEAAAILGLPNATLLAWCFGQGYALSDGSPKRFKPLVRPADSASRYLSFTKLCELHALAVIRRLHRIQMNGVRKSPDYVGKQLGVARPLVAEQFLINGVDLFIQKAQLINVSCEGQTALRGEFEQALARIERGPGGGPIRLFPYSRIRPDAMPQPKAVAVDPRLAFGRPILLKAGVTTDVIRDRFMAGDSFDEMVLDYLVSEADIAEALRFEQRLAA